MSAPYDLFDYPAYWKGRSFEDLCEKLALQKFFAKIDDKGSILDIGGGFGRLTPFYAPLFKTSVVVEPSERLINVGQQNLKGLKDITFKQGSLPDLPFADESFDLAMMIRVIHHFDSSQPPISEAARVIKKRGYFILEFANKIHFLARLRATLRGEFSFSKDTAPIDLRSKKSIDEEKIVFVDHHPKLIFSDLAKAGFTVVDTLSVSNFRSQLLKKIVPEKFLLFLESRLQRSLAKAFFGPSIFILAKKKF